MTLKACVCVCQCHGCRAECPWVSAVSHSAGDTRASSSTTTAIATQALSARWPKPMSHMAPELPLHHWPTQGPWCLSEHCPT